MSEFIGSRISLISKSDIRYVGILHEINSENSTVALEQVVSFGTEGRRGDPAKEIPAADNVYEYIVFRGSDVKDLRIEEPAKSQQPTAQVPDDPAILTSTTKPPAPAQTFQQQQQQPQQPQQLQQTQFPQGIHHYYQQNPQLPRYGGYPPYGGFYPGYHPMAPPGSQQFMPPGGQAQQFPRQIQPGQAPIGPATSRPQPPSHASQVPQVNQPIGQPTATRGNTPFAQNQVAQQQQVQVPSQVLIKAQSLPEQAANKPGTPAALSQPTLVPPTATVEEPKEKKPIASPPVKSETSPLATSPAPPTQTRQQTPKPVVNVPTAPKGGGGIVPALPLTDAGQPSQSIASTSPVPAIANKHTSPEPATTESKAAASLNEASAAVEQLAQKVSQLRASSAQQSNSNTTPTDVQRPSRQQNSRARGGFRGGYHASRKVEIPATDFDFESANAKFNKQDLIKEVIAAEETSPLLANGDSALNGNKSPDEGDTILQQPEQPYYSKQKSFFDNISCESKERAENKDTEKRGGATWRGEEVKRNIETFGQGSVDSGYHRYGRGGGYRGGRGRGGYNRGNGGYRGGRGYHRGANNGVATHNHW